MTRVRWREWKARVRIVHVLADIGQLPHFRISGRRLTGPCPVHGGDNRRAFSVDRERDLWFCFTRCQAGGDVINLAWRLSGQSWSRTAQWLERLAGAPVDSQESGLVALSTKPIKRTLGAFRAFTCRLPLTASHPFFRRLQIREETLRLFEAGAWLGGGFLKDTVAVRVHDLCGRPLGYAGRRLNEAAICRWGKWKWPTGLPKAQFLWNWHRISPASADGLIVVEGPWSVMKLWQAGLRNAVAICGAHVSERQVALLQRARSVTLLLDGDPTGRQAAARSLASAFHLHLRVVHVPDGSDPADLTEDHLRALLMRG